MQIILSIIIIVNFITIILSIHNIERMKNYPRLSDKERELLRHMIDLSISNYGDNKQLKIIYSKLGGKVK